MQMKVLWLLFEKSTLLYPYIVSQFSLIRNKHFERFLYFFMSFLHSFFIIRVIVL